MSIVALLVEMLKSGKVTVSANNTPTLEIEAENRKIDINAIDKKIIKTTLEAAKNKKTNHRSILSYKRQSQPNQNSPKQPIHPERCS